MRPTAYPPPPQEGINRWCLVTALRAKHGGRTRAEAVALISSFDDGTLRRPLKDAEITRAVDRAWSGLGGEETSQDNEPDWNPAKTDLVFQSQGITRADLLDASPTDPKTPQVEILRGLFPKPGGLLCIGRNKWDFTTAALEDHDLPGSLIVPGYMTKPTGWNQKGEKSAHCLDNTGDRRFLVVDLDAPDPVQHPSILWELACRFQLVMIVSSGGKSLHGWFRVPVPDQDRFWSLALKLGADVSIKRNRSSFVRIPQGFRRESGTFQPVLFLDLCTTD